MSTVFYKDYSITPSAVLDELTGKYAPCVNIAWRESDGEKDAYSFTLSKRYSTFNEAQAVASQEAQAWADRWLIHVGP